MPDPGPHIVVEDLRIGWGTRVLMEHVSFEVERGTTFAILGGSGSGKSTLLRYLIGLEQPMSGRIQIDGVGEPHRYEGVPPFGVLFQSGALFSSLTLAGNLELPLTTWTPVRGLDPITAFELDQLIIALSRDLGITIVIVTHELPSIFLVATSCIVLDKVAKGIVARGDPKRLRDESEIPFVHGFFTRSSTHQ